MFMSWTARNALRPRQGAAAACADSPVNVYSTEIMPLLPLGWPQAVLKSLPTWVNSTASTSLNTPARTR